MKTNWDLTYLYKSDDEWNDSCKEIITKLDALEKKRRHLLKILILSMNF